MNYVLISGVMGSGKTTIAEYMKEQLGFYMLHPGNIRKKDFGHLTFTRPEFEAALKEHVLMIAAYRAESALSEGRNVVVENQALKNESRHILLNIAGGAKKYWILPEAEPETRIRRVAERPKGFGKGLSYEEVKRLVYGDMARWENPDMFKDVEVIRYINETEEDLRGIKKDLQCRFSV